MEERQYVQMMRSVVRHDEWYEGEILAAAQSYQRGVRSSAFMYLPSWLIVSRFVHLAPNQSRRKRSAVSHAIVSC